MTIRIGANPIGWSNDDLPEIGGNTPLEVCLAEAKEAGFEGMELGNKFPREPAALKAVLDKFDLACIGNWYSIELLNRTGREEFEGAKAHRELMKAMGTDVFIVAETSNAIHGQRDVPLSRRPVMTTSAWIRYGERITQLAQLLAAEGLKLSYHHHMGTIVQSEDDIHAFMSHTESPVNLLLDTGHATWAGADPVALARRYKNRIAHVHCKDVRLDIKAKADAGDWSFLDAVLGQEGELGIYTVPGDGSVDYVSVFRALSGYSGWVVVEAEQDPEKANPLKYAKKGVENLKRFLREGGLQ